MCVQGKWRVGETPDHDMAGPGAYILFGKTGEEFAFDCLTGSIHGACDGNTVEFSWTGNGEWSPPAATVGPSCRKTAPSKERSPSATAMMSPSSLADK
jgi:hypothetical protein